MWKQVLLYGGLLAIGSLLLQWLDYQHLARMHSDQIYILMIAVAFLVLGIFVGARVMGGHKRAESEGNPQAVGSLGISERELTVLRAMAAGYSNKEIAQLLNVSPNTIKTHVARLLEKLGAKRRTDAINRARELGILS